MYVAAVFLALLQAVAVVDAAFAPKQARNIQARHAALLHARSPATAPPPLVKRRDSKKCRARPSSSAQPAPSAPPVNAGSNPDKPQPDPVEQPKPTEKPKPSPSPTHREEPKPTKGNDDNNDNDNGGGNNNGGGGGGGGPFGGFHAGTRHGELTFYSLGLTACGQSFSDGDFVAAVSHSLFDSVPGANGNPNSNPICGKKIVVSFGGKSVTVAVRDRCEGCAPDDIDLSPTAFSVIASQSLGRIQGSWHWA